MTDMPLLIKLSDAVVSRPDPKRQLLPVRALLAVAAVGLAAGFVASGGPESQAAVQSAGPELTRLLRAMAVLKLSFVGLGVWLSALRLRMPVSAGRTVAYMGAVAAIALAPGLIWNMTWVALGAALLHGGLVALAVIAWTDPGTGPALNAWVARRRAALNPDRSVTSR